MKTFFFTRYPGLLLGAIISWLATKMNMRGDILGMYLQNQKKGRSTSTFNILQAIYI